MSYSIFHLLVPAISDRLFRIVFKSSYRLVKFLTYVFSHEFGKGCQIKLILGLSRKNVIGKMFLEKCILQNFVVKCIRLSLEPENPCLSRKILARRDRAQFSPNTRIKASYRPRKIVLTNHRRLVPRIACLIDQNQPHKFYTASFT